MWQSYDPNDSTTYTSSATAKPFHPMYKKKQYAHQWFKAKCSNITEHWIRPDWPKSHDYKLLSTWGRWTTWAVIRLCLSRRYKTVKRQANSVTKVTLPSSIRVFFNHFPNLGSMLGAPLQVMMACVKSVEDHGYVLSFGLPSFSSFLPHRDNKSCIHAFMI